MRTVILLGALAIATAINREAFGASQEHFYTIVTYVAMVMDVIDFFKEDK